MTITSHPANAAYRDNFDATFGKKPEPSCNCKTPGVGIQRNTCLSPLRAVCQCVCHYPAEPSARASREP